MEKDGQNQSEKSLADLEAENRQLKAQIKQYEEGLPNQGQNSTDQEIKKLKEANEDIADQIKSFTSIAEDVSALRVFEKAKSYLIGWITVGGVAALLGAAAVFFGTKNYATQLVRDQMTAVAGKQLTDIVQKEAEHQVAEYFKEHQSQYDARVDQLIVVQVGQAYSTLQGRLPYGSATKEAVSSRTVAQVGPALDYTAQMGSVRSQDQEGASTGFSIAYALEFQVMKATSQRVRLSPREIYNLARLRENTLSSDAGATLEDAVKVVQTDGAILDEVWPYKAGQFSAQPPKEFAAATKYKAKSAVAVKGVDQIKSALVSAGPVVVGVTVYNGFESPDVAKTGIVPMPGPKDIIVGGHPICIVGYDDAKKLFKFINSWGPDWGEKGYGYIPYDYIKSYSSDAWSISM